MMSHLTLQISPRNVNNIPGNRGILATNQRYKGSSSARIVVNHLVGADRVMKHLIFTSTPPRGASKPPFPRGSTAVRGRTHTEK